MKKSKLLSIVLTAVLVLTTVFAGTESIFAGTVTSGGVTPSIIAAQDVNKVTDENPLIVYTANMTTGTDYRTVIPVTVEKAGTISVPLAGIAVGKNVTVSLHSTSAATDGDKIGYAKYLSSSSPTNTLYGKVSKAGTYYLKFETASYSAGTQQTVNFNVAFYPAGGTLTKGKVFYGSNTDSSALSYYKVTVPSNGYLTVSFPESVSSYPSYNIKLLNYKKNSLYPNFLYVSSSDGYTTRIGVAKGTYYIAVKNSDDAYGIKVSFTKVTESSGSTKSKAKSISKGSTKKGIITASQSDTSGDWYKFKITKTQYVKFNVTIKSNGGGGSGGLKFSFYQAGKSYPAFTKSAYGNATGTIQPYTYGSGTKLAPGTYYIKVQKYSYGNGYYTIKWV